MGTLVDAAAGDSDGLSIDQTVYDNSLNYVFFPSLFPTLSPYDADDEGQYNIRLSVFDDDELLAVVEFVVAVTDDYPPII